jgi:hypothetical protein
MQLITDKKPLGKGFNGTVYKCKYNNINAILKIGKYLPDEPEFARQVKFDLLVAKKHPGRFLQLLHAGIINDCSYAFKPKHPKGTPRAIIDYYAKLKASKQCSVLVYSPVLRHTLDDVVDKLPIETRKAIYQHLRKSLDMMHQIGLSHNDIHRGNIMCQKPADPSSYMLIDYGNINDAADKQNAMDRLRIKIYAHDDADLCWCFIHDDTITYMYKNNTFIDNRLIDKASAKIVPGNYHPVVKGFILYCRQYHKYLKILGCSAEQITKAKQDPLASYLLRSLLNHIKK